ncbi:hypothetical protein [Streptomyces sp. NPDC005302]|uniref:hypothetical protein n=1 Tax=Streptomyces sp. NPDC005302 TaxID=3154675 RepID=UPI0033BF5587
MLTEEDARQLVLAQIDDMRGTVEYDLQILRVEALPFGWIFYWGAVWDGRSGQRPRLGGNGPFLMDRDNERLIRLGTGIPVTRQVADYERRLPREAHARNTAAKRLQQRGTATPAATSVRYRPSGASKRPE